MSRILIVEDDPAILRGLADNLAYESYEVFTASDGEAGYRLIREKDPDLVILDLMLPKLNGYEVCRRIRAEGYTTPIVMLSAQGQEADRVFGLDLGANDYVTKPLSVRELLARVRAIFRMHQEQLSERRHFEHEIHIASEVQRRLFPQSRPALASLDYVGCCQPASGVGGDYFDFLELAPGKLALVVADVAGKGVSAALLMASLHGCVRANAPLFGEQCSALLTKVNALLYEATGAERFATLFYGVYDDATHRFTYINAGHPSPLLIHRGAASVPAFRKLDSNAPPVGIFLTLSPLQQSVQLLPEDWLLIFTDGLTEALNGEDEEFGTDRLLKVFSSNCYRTATEMRDVILTEVDRHAGGRPPSDDRTLIVARVVQRRAQEHCQS